MTSVVPSARWRSTSLPAAPEDEIAAATARRVASSPKGTTSIGSGKRPSVCTSLPSSAITIMRADAAATIFSRSSAAPPPLIRRSCGSTSSAPSTVRSSSGVSSSVDIGMPSETAWTCVASEVETQRTSKPAATFAPSRSTKCFAVEPVPRPSRIPGCTSSSARAAARFFRSSAFMVLVRLRLWKTPAVQAGRHGALLPRQDRRVQRADASQRHFVWGVHTVLSSKT